MRIMEIKIICIVQLSLTYYSVYQRQMMCSNRSLSAAGRAEGASNSAL